ncbi:MAG: SRPBCC domain-containing protein [Thermodesulfovibrionales bacterium]|nr:SRPBCC domain-containing protein [Thermodesulfovibrionales bacterium]
MIIEASIEINADIRKVWSTFTDLTCWNDWTSIVQYAFSESKRIEEGKSFSFCLRAFTIPVSMKPFVEAIEPMKRIVWKGSKFWVSARHEFLFEEYGSATKVISREKISGIFIPLISELLIKKILQNVTLKFLNELKRSAEQKIQ